MSGSQLNTHTTTAPKEEASNKNCQENPVSKSTSPFMTFDEQMKKAEKAEKAPRSEDEAWEAREKRNWELYDNDYDMDPPSPPGLI